MPRKKAMEPSFLRELFHVASSEEVRLPSTTNPSVSPRDCVDTVDILLDSHKHNTWTNSQRQLLCCCYAFFTKDWAKIVRIFNNVFREHVQACGFENGLPSTTLVTQWHDMRNKGSSIWADIHMRTRFRNRYERWAGPIQTIKNAARDLGIPIVEKYNHAKTRKFGCRARRPNRIQDNSEEIQSFNGDRLQDPAEVGIDTEVHDAREPSESPPSTPETEPLCTAAGKICIFCFKEGLLHTDSTEVLEAVPEPESTSAGSGIVERGLSRSTPSKMPELLYRWFNIDSQGVNSKNRFEAGLFAERGGVITPVTEYSSIEFDRMFENHVRIAETTTPFISTSSSPLSPIHRALRGQEGASIAVIDTAHIDNPIYLAELLLKERKLKVSRFYKGYAEYLVWGSIPKRAIAATFKISELQKIVQQHSEIARLLQLDVIASFKRNRKALKRRLVNGPGRLNKGCGSTIGRLLNLLEIPENLTIAFATSIASAWRFRREGSILDYIEGVKAARGLSLANPTTHALVFNASNCVDIASDGDVTVSESCSNSDDDEIDQEEKYNDVNSDEENDNSSSGITTPCPSPRIGRTRRALDIALLGSDSPPLQLPTPEKLSPMMKFFDSTTGTWNHDQEEQKGLHVEVFSPTTRAWSPLADQTGLLSANNPSPGGTQESAIVIDDEEGEKENHDDEDGQQTGYDGDDSDTDTVMGDISTQLAPEPNNSTVTRESPADRFARERARINNIMGYL